MIQFLSGNNKFALYGAGKSSYSEEELQEYGLPKDYTREEILMIVGIGFILGEKRSYIFLAIQEKFLQRKWKGMLTLTGTIHPILPLENQELNSIWKMNYKKV